MVYFIQKGLAFSCIVLFFISSFLYFVAIILAPFVINMVDRQLAPLAQKGDTLSKGYPFSMSRMGWYGFVLTFRRFRLIQRWLLRNRDDRLQAINTVPSWMGKLVVWVYLDFFVCVATLLMLIGVMMLLDRYGYLLA